jgi:sugar lactone lactonase YvrE
MRRELLGILILAACSGGSAESGGSSTSGGTTTGGETTSAGTSTGEAPTTSEGEASTTSGSTEVGTSSSEGTSSGEASSSEGTTGAGLDCQDVSDGPWVPALWVEGFDGSEDLAFDGNGGLALKRDGEVVVVAADKSETVLAVDVPQAYGTRYLGDGRLIVALPGDGKVIAIDEGGAISDFVTGVDGANGLYPDLAGDVWITEFGGDRVIRVGEDLTRTTIVMGGDAAAANGVVYDPSRGLLFYTNYQAGQVRRVAIDEQGQPGAPELVVTLAGTKPDGLAMDACGYLYVVNQGGNELYRVLLDEAGAASVTPDAPMAVFPSNVANAQFGVGPGFDPTTLYVAGNPGDVYTLQVEFPGAPIVSP